MFFGLRFDFRNPDLGGVSTADRYAAALEEAAGGSAVVDTVLREVSEAAADVGIAPATRESSELAERLAEVDLAP